MEFCSILFSPTVCPKHKINVTFSGSTVELISPIDPKLPTDSKSDIDKQPSSDVTSGWRYGAKKILGSFGGVFKRLNQLLLKVVAKMFPWNRRARRRLQFGEDDADEL